MAYGVKSKITATHMCLKEIMVVVRNQKIVAAMVMARRGGNLRTSVRQSGAGWPAARCGWLRERDGTAAGAPVQWTVPTAC